MMLTAGIEDEEGKNRPFGLAGGAAAADAAPGEAAGAAEGVGRAAATGESVDCGHSRA